MTDNLPPRPEVDAELIRRRHARLRLGIPARFETFDGHLQVRLVDLSQSGAHVILPEAVVVTEGVLTWMKFDTFGVTVWQDGDNVGLEFDRPLSTACLRATREEAPEIFRDAARSFVEGTDGTLR